MPLTLEIIDNAQPGVNRRGEATTRPYKLGDARGLFLEVPPIGRKRWRLKYRFEGKEKRLSLGVYPAVTLQMARERHGEARKLIAQGIDPGEVRREERARERAKLKQQAAVNPVVRVVASLDGAIEIWKGDAMVRLTQCEAASTQGLLARLTG